MRYWLGEEYLGFGPAAHAYFNGVRYATPADTSHYIAAVREGALEALRTDCHTLHAHEAREEYVMLRMRLATGVDKQDFARRFGLSFERAYGNLDTLVANGLLTNTPSRVAFTARGMQVSNAILSEWLDFNET
jgi:oxygen-independent coproporphyrinogen-3 oxidase